MVSSTPTEPGMQPPQGLRIAGWLLIGSGALLWLNEALVHSGYMRLVLAVVAAGAGICTIVLAWKPLPRLCWLGLIVLVTVVGVVASGPLIRVGSAWVWVGLGATLRSRARERHGI
jgi:hypothetical protein